MMKPWRCVFVFVASTPDDELEADATADALGELIESRLGDAWPDIEGVRIIDVDVIQQAEYES